MGAVGGADGGRPSPAWEWEAAREGTARRGDLRATFMVLDGIRFVVISHPLAPASEDAAPLTAAEADVASLAMQGLSNAEIAARRGAAVRTVANQMASILRKLRVASRRELAVRLVRGELGAADAPPDGSEESC